MSDNDLSIQHLFSLEGKVALVTGGSRGLGRAISLGLAAEGARVAVNYRQSGEKAEALVVQIERDYGVEAVAVQADVASEAEVRKMFRITEETFSRVDILVNNAWGGGRIGRIEKKSEALMQHGLAIGFLGPFWAMVAAHPIMKAKGWGRIINISSVNGQKGQFGQTNYSTAKAGIHGFTMALAQEVASKGVTVNTVSPGYIGTEMVRAVKPEVLEKIVATIPVKRLGEPEEIGSIVAWLASDESAFATGADFSLNGGLHMS